MKYIALALAEKIIGLLDESGATEVEKLAALRAALSVVPTTEGPVHLKAVSQEQEEV
jgi:hypothetical protein